MDLQDDVKHLEDRRDSRPNTAPVLSFLSRFESKAAFEESSDDDDSAFMARFEAVMSDDDGQDETNKNW